MARSPRTLLPMLTAFGAVVLVPSSASAATITVNSTADTVANDGVCAVREAITAANSNTQSGASAGECVKGDASPTADTIAFGIAGPGPHLISPGSALPPITEMATIDGADALPAGPPVDEVRIDGAGAGVSFGIDVETSIP